MASSKKVKSAKEARDLTQIPNIGPAMVKDLHILNITQPSDLNGCDPYELYVELCDKTKAYHDPCVLDTFLAAVDFMNGKKAKPWWDFTKIRKKNFSKVENRVARWR